MEDQFVPYELAVKLKELGFDEGCLGTYSGDVLEIGLDIPSDDYFTRAPLYQQVFDWFRIKKQLNVSLKLVTVSPSKGSKGEKTLYSATIHVPGNESIVLRIMNFEDMRKKCLERLIEIVENKENG